MMTSKTTRYRVPAIANFLSEIAASPTRTRNWYEMILQRGSLYARRKTCSKSLFEIALMSLKSAFSI
jgi:hypothetical protein